MSLQEGDVLRFDYTLWIDGEKKPLDTSQEEVARETGIHNEQKHYHPLTITLGRRQVIPGLEKHLLGLDDATAPTEVTIPPSGAYGERDPAKVKDVPMAQFRKQKIDPQVGLELNMGGERAVVTRVAGGRVRVDTNHDLAGKTLRYQITPVAVLTDRRDKVQAVLDNLFMGGTPFELTDDTLTVEVPQQAMFDRNWAQAKFRVITELKAAAGEPVVVKLVETYPAMPQDVPAAGGEEE